MLSKLGYLSSVMRKLLLFLVVAGLLLTFSALFRGVFDRATGGRQDPSEATGKPVDDSRAPLAPQSNAPDVGGHVPDSATVPRRDVPESGSLNDALNSYDELYQAIFARKGGSREEYTELGRRRKAVESLLTPRIAQAIRRKYERRPPFQDYPVVVNNVVDMIYAKPCRGCVNIDFEILAPTDVIQGTVPGYLPYDGFRISLRCPVKMNIARVAGYGG